MFKRLVYRADDIGYTATFDLGAFEAIDKGIVTSADVMLDSPDTVEALKRLKDRPWISIGWHRHLWESPVVDPKDVPSMVDSEGRFKWRHRHPELMDAVPYHEAYLEFKAELARCYAILGRYPDTATTRPGKNELEKAFSDICEEYHIACNICGGVVLKADPKYAYLNYTSKIIHPPVTYSDDEYDLANFKDYDTVKNIMSLSWDSEEQIVMFGGHPGYLDEHIYLESRCNIHRLEELRGCIHPDVKKWIIDNKIELLNQRDVMTGSHEYQDHLREIGSPLWVGNFK